VVLDSEVLSQCTRITHKQTDRQTTHIMRIAGDCNSIPTLGKIHTEHGAQDDSAFIAFTCHIHCVLKTRPLISYYAITWASVVHKAAWTT